MSVTDPVVADLWQSHAKDGRRGPNSPHALLQPQQEQQQEQQELLPTLAQEAYYFVELAAPTVLISVGFTVPSFYVAAFVGRTYGPVRLDAYALANLTGNLFSLSLLAGLYSASDTLSPQAFGAGNYRRVGLVALRALVASVVVLIPVNVVLYAAMGPLLVWLGQDEAVSEGAWSFYVVYAAALPCYAVWCVACKFLTAQAVTRPLVVVTLSAVCLVLPAATQTVGRPVDEGGWGFEGAAAALVVMYAYQAAALFAYLAVVRPHVAETWPTRWTWSEVLDQKALTEFGKLAAGGMMASLEWMYWEAVSLVVGVLGVVPLSVHTVPTQVIYVAFMLPLGVGIAVSNRIGVTLGKSVARAKWLAVATMTTSAVVFGVWTVLLYRYRWPVFALFTADANVLQGCDEIWPLVCLYLWVLSLFGVTTGIATGLGMQMTLGMWTIFFLWCLGLPASYYFAIVRQQGLVAIWTWIIPPYALISIVMGFHFVWHDWEDIANLIRIREGLINTENDKDKDDRNGNDDAEGLESLRLTESTSNTNYRSTTA